MKNIVIISLGIALLALTAVASTGGQNSLSGDWIVKWLDNNTLNPMTISQADGRLMGTYINDSKEICSVTGHPVKNSSRVTLNIDCPKWDISMEGTVSGDGNTIEGTYRAYGTSQGGFLMTRKQQRQ